jgi:hypothetical protein
MQISKKMYIYTHVTSFFFLLPPLVVSRFCVIILIKKKRKAQKGRKPGGGGGSARFPLLLLPPYLLALLSFSFLRPSPFPWKRLRAATDSQLLTPNGPNTAGDDLRKRALEFYAKAIRHNKLNKSMDVLPSPRKAPSAASNWHCNGHALVAIPVSSFWATFPR